MIVLDASAAVSALLQQGVARTAIADEQVHVPHLIDAEVTSALRRRVLAGRLAAGTGRACLRAWQGLALTRYPGVGLLGRVWLLRDNLSAYDAMYIALAEALGCEVLTADARLAGAPGIRCPVTVVPA